MIEKILLQERNFVNTEKLRDKIMSGLSKIYRWYISPEKNVRTFDEINISKHFTILSWGVFSQKFFYCAIRSIEMVIISSN